MHLSQAGPRARLGAAARPAGATLGPQPAGKMDDAPEEDILPPWSLKWGGKGRWGGESLQTDRYGDKQ